MNAVGDEEEVSVLAQVLAEGHVGVQKSLNKVWPGLFVVDEGSFNEVGGGDVGDVPQPLPTVLYDVHVVGAACVIF